MQDAELAFTCPGTDGIWMDQHRIFKLHMVKPIRFLGSWALDLWEEIYGCDFDASAVEDKLKSLYNEYVYIYIYYKYVHIMYVYIYIHTFVNSASLSIRATNRVLGVLQKLLLPDWLSKTVEQ